MNERSTVKRLVDNLVKRELVEIVAHPTNRKTKLIQLTDQGETVRLKGNQIVTDVQSQWLDALPESERAHLKSALSLLLEKN